MVRSAALESLVSLVAGVPGPIATRLRQILHADMEGGLPGDRIQVPYIEPTAI